MEPIIAVDARTIYASRRRGTGKNLLDVYREMAKRRPQWQYVLYHQSSNGDDPFAAFPNVGSQCLEMPGDKFHLWEQFRLPVATSIDRANLLHCPTCSCPRFSAVPIVSTIHDLIPLKISDSAHDSFVDGFRTKVQRCLRKSARIIAVSEHTKRDLISDFGTDANRIDVISWAPDAAYAPVRDEARLAALRSRYNLRDKYLLAFSGRSPRKNAEGMIRAFARLGESLQRRVQFLLIGVEPAGKRAVLKGLIERLGLRDHCLVRGFAPEADIPELLSGAVGLAFCSLYEGFGLPILDAFCCETPVLTSNVSSMPEVAGDAALFCDPSDPDSIAAGMTRLLTDEAMQEGLVQRGLHRVKQYTWCQTAETICRTFEKCL